MTKAKLTTIPALLAAASLGGAGVYFYDGETYEKITLAPLLPPAPITDALLLTAPQDCLAEIQAVGDDPRCSLVIAWYPLGGEVRYPAPVYTEEGEVVPPSLSEMRELNFVAREVWACGDGAVMPQRIQNCLDTLHAEAPVEVVEAVE